jgi:hypothetical protein
MEPTVVATRSSRPTVPDFFNSLLDHYGGLAPKPIRRWSTFVHLARKQEGPD